MRFHPLPGPAAVAIIGKFDPNLSLVGFHPLPGPAAVAILAQTWFSIYRRCRFHLLPGPAAVAMARSATPCRLSGSIAVFEGSEFGDIFPAVSPYREMNRSQSSLMPGLVDLVLGSLADGQQQGVRCRSA